MTIPCKECLTIPICKNQEFNQTLNKCILLKQHMRDKTQYYAKMKSMGRPTTDFTLSVRMNEIKKVFWLKVTEHLIFVSDKIDFTSTSEYVIRRYRED